jgi:ATP-dependent Clp protease protease subunit
MLDIRSSTELFEYGVDIERRRILLTGQVTEEMLNRVLSAAARFDVAPGALITCDIATVGGCMYNGLGIYDALVSMRRRGAVVRMVGYGYIMSMGATLLQAASDGERLLAPHTTVMIHQGQETVPPDIHPNEHKRLTKEFDRIAKVGFGIIADRMGMNLPAWKKKHAYDTYFDAAGAIKAGLADRITED